MFKTRFGRVSARALLTGLAGLSIAACADDGDGLAPTPPLPPPPPTAPPPPAPPPPPPSSASEAASAHGSGFSMAFAADPTFEPADPGPGDITPVDPAADPIDIADPA